MCTAVGKNGKSGGSKTPYEFLGIAPGCSLEEAKAAFKTKVKQFHPDVYKGEDATDITSRLLLAYEIVKDEVSGAAGGDDSVRGYEEGGFAESDPFRNPRGPANRIFVNELNCIGRGCLSCCVDKLPGIFNFSVDTEKARCYSSKSIATPELEYPVYLAVEQCPRKCIHYVTTGQLLSLQREFQQVLDGEASPEEISYRLYDLLSVTKFENGRERTQRSSRTKPKKSTKWVDWY